MSSNISLQMILSATNDTGDAFDALDGAISSVSEATSGLADSFGRLSGIIDSSMRGADEAVSALSTPAADAKDAISSMGTDFDDVSRAATESMSAAKESIESLTAPAGEASDAVSTLGTRFGTIGTSADDSSNSAKDALDSIVTPLTNISDKLDTIITLFKDFGTESATSIGEVKDAINGLATPISGINDKLNVVKDSTGKVSGSAKEMGLMMGAMALQQVFQPFVDGAQSATENFSTFDTSMRQVNQEAGLSQAGFSALEQQVLGLSSASGIAGSDLSSGLYNIMSTGSMTAAQAMQRLQAAAEGAKAGNTDLATTTAALDSVMGAYHMNASQAQKVMDTMFAATQNGQMHFADLARSVGASATSASIAGVSYSQLAAAQATLTNVGKNAEMASQNLNSLITGIIAPTSAATKEAKSLGIEWDASALKAHGLSYMVQEAMTATDGNTAKLKALIPNQRAYTAELALGGSAHQQYLQTLSKVSSANGATASALAQSEQSMGDQLEKAKNTMTVAGEQMLIALAPVITQLSNGVEKLSGWFQHLGSSNKEMVAIFIGLGAVIGAVIAPIALLVAAIVAAGAPVAIFIGALVGLSAVAAVVIAHWKPISTFFSTLWSGVVTVFTTVWTGIESFFTGVFNWITSFFTQWGPVILAVLVPFIGIPLLIYQHFGQITAWLQSVWDSVVQGVSQFSANVVHFFENLPQEIGYALGFAIGSVIKWGVDLVTWATTDLPKFISSVISFFEQLPGKIWNSFLEDMLQLANFAVRIESWATTEIPKFVGNVVTFFSELPGKMWDTLVSIVTSIGTWGKNMISAAQAAVPVIVNDVVTWFEDLPKDMLDIGTNIVKGLWQGVQSMIGWFQSQINSFFGGIISGAKAALGIHSPSTVFAEIGNYTTQGFIQGLTQNSAGVTAAFNSLMPSNVIPVNFAASASRLATGTYGAAAAMSGPSAVRSSVSAGTTVVFQTQVSGNVTKSEDELANKVATKIYQNIKMSGKF